MMALDAGALTAITTLEVLALRLGLNVGAAGRSNSCKLTYSTAVSACARTTYTASEARARLSELLDESADNEVFIARHGKPVVALISFEHYGALLDTLEALEEELLAERAPSHAGSHFRRKRTDPRLR